MTTTVLAYIPSPAQGVWQLGPLPIRAYAMFIIAGIIVALLIGDRRWAARGGEPGVIYDIVLWAVPFGLIGGRLYHVITDWQKYFGEGGAGFIGALRIWDGGLGIWGAVALGGVGAWIGCRRHGIPLPAFGDAIAPGIILAQAIGRLGNYFNQELYGRATTVPWGLEIYERRNANGALDNLNGVSTGQLEAVVHPTFLYELLWNLVVFAALIFIDRRWRIGHGRLFAMYVAGYCLGRFWIELLRSDEAQLLAGIRINSFTATFVFIGAVVYVMVAPKGREAPETLAGKQDADVTAGAGAKEVVKDVTVASGAGVVAAVKAAESDAVVGPEPEPDAPDAAGLGDAAPEADVGELEAGPSEPESDSVVGSVDGVAEPAEESEVDPDAELAAELAHAAEVMAADAARRVVDLGAVSPAEMGVEGVVEAPAQADEVNKPIGDGPLRQYPPFDSAADAELAAELAHVAEVMAAEYAGGRDEQDRGEVPDGQGSAVGSDEPVERGEAAVDALASTDAQAESPDTPAQASATVSSSQSGGGIRNWLRGRRNR